MTSSPTPDPNNELRHLIRSAKEEVSALDARFDRLDSRMDRIEKVTRDNRDDADLIRTTLDTHTALLNRQTEVLNHHTGLLNEHTERLRGIDAKLDEVLRRLSSPGTEG